MLQGNERALMRGLFCRWALAGVLGVWALFAAEALSAEGLSPQEADALYRQALKFERPDSIRKAADRLKEALKNYPAPALLKTRIGMLYVRARETQQARAIFREALLEDSTLIAARYGLGQVYLEQMDNPKRALHNLERAIEIDSTYAEAHLLMGRAYLKMGKKKEVLEAAEAALRHDPGHAQAYLLLAEFYLKEGNGEEAVRYFRKFLAQNPEDEGTAFDFAFEMLDLGEYEAVLQLADLMDDLQGLPLRALVLVAWGDYEEALETFEGYIALLPQRTQAVYYDISLVGLPEDVSAYNNTPPEEREAFLQRFWLKRDPFKTSGGAMRRVEHYRRVWRAMTLYGKIQWPFDQRGAVYVRYGEPDWRSNWKNINAVVPLRVQRVQEKYALQLYGNQAHGMTFFGPVFPIKAERTAERTFANTQIESRPQPLSTFNELDVGLQYYKPVTAGMDRSSVGWEVWIYTDIENGLEVVFTDELYSGVYDFAPMPTLFDEDISEYNMQRMGPAYRLISRLPYLAPGAQIDRLSRDLPERYDISHLEPLEFYYEVLSFRGENGSADLQLNFGLPLDHVTLDGDGDTTVTVERRIALINDRNEVVQKTRERLAVRVSENSRGRSLVAMDRVNFAAAPGNYELALQIARMNTNRLQAYQQEVSVPDYNSGELILSDLQLAQRVAEAGPDSDPRFVRGKWQITPSPSRAFRTGDPVFVYFEIYNLSRNEFGNTRYEVGYEVRRGGKKLRTRARKATGETVSVSYQQVGTEPTETDYVELDLGDARPGRYRVRMTVKDLNSGQETVREGRFQVLEK